MRKLLQYWWVRGLVLLAPTAAMACTPATNPLPAPPQKPVIAKVAIPVPCEIAQVPVPDYPSRVARKGDDIFTLAKIALAELEVRRGETVELRAANTGGCE